MNDPGPEPVTGWELSETDLEQVVGGLARVRVEASAGQARDPEPGLTT